MKQALIFILLALFLKWRPALWVAVGLPIALLGAVWILPATDTSINMLSLFAFILALGIVVDDAIIVGENVYTHYQRHRDPSKAAIDGAREVTAFTRRRRRRRRRSSGRSRGHA